METKRGDLEHPTSSSTNTSQTEDKAVVTPAASSSASVLDVPDPDEDDLDDLDDMLDEFSSTRVDSEGVARHIPEITVVAEQARGGTANKEGLSTHRTEVEGLTDEDFTRQLKDGMADMLGNTSSDWQAQFETMLKDLGGADVLGADAGAASDPTAAKTKSSFPSPMTEDSFQDTIKKTMERMQESGDQATAAAAAEDSDDILAELMKQMQSSGLDGEGSEEDFSKMLLGMMEQLTNKDILYEPMKELDDKFPEWMTKNKTTISTEDLARYKEQQTVVHEIVAKFEEMTYADSNTADREYIVDRMQKMQAAGAPPPDLVGEMASAQEAFGAPDEGCPQQ